MTTKAKSLPEKIRVAARAVLCELGAAREEKLRETMLIREGNYCGHRYRMDGFEAVWFIEEDELKFSDQSGTVAKKLVASEAIERIERETIAPRRAA